MKKNLLGKLLTLCMVISIITVFIAQAAAVDFKGTSLGDPSKAGEPTPTPTPTPTPATTNIDFKGSSLGDPSKASEPTPTPTPTPTTTNIDFKGSSLGDPSRAGEPTPAKDIIVKVNDKPVVFDVKPTIINDRTLVPLRAIFEALGAQVTWDGETNTIYASKGNSIIILQIDNKKAFVNSKEVTLDVAPQIIEDRTLVPTRFIAEALGADVQWDGEKNMVVIKTNEVVTYKKITPELAKQLLENKNVLLIDVRTPDEYQAGHIKSSVNITNTELKSKITQFASDKDTVIIVYCRSGARSKVSAEELIGMGYANVSDLGGIIDWPYEIEK